MPDQRPAVHFTADSGWINDPYGVVWHDGEYHLFYQYVPGSQRWAASCHWGHATAPDLVRWRIREPALTPTSAEAGCWSGAAVGAEPDGSGELQLFYTRVDAVALGRGSVVRARPDPAGPAWHADPPEPVVSMPADPDLLNFRDPCVFRHGGRWVMVVGGGTTDGRGTVLQWVSDDLVTWTPTGVVVDRSATETEPLWAGSTWECPQLFPLDDAWVLVVSVWASGVLYDVVAAVGDYDGERFVPTSWQQLTTGGSAYATTSFADRAGRRCLLSWLREAEPFDPDAAVRAGAQSLPYVVSLDADRRLRLTPHPDVESLRGRVVAPEAPDGGVQRFRPGRAFDLALGRPDPTRVVRLLDGAGDVLHIEGDSADRVVVDGGIVEISGRAPLEVRRLPPPATTFTVEVTGVAGALAAVACWDLVTAWPGGDPPARPT